MSEIEKASAELQELVAKSDTGARKPAGLTGAVLFTVSLGWALFQLWYASPLPFVVGFGIFNDTEARAIHLAFALFLAFVAWPAFSGSPRDRVPLVDWAVRARRCVRRRLPDAVLCAGRTATRASRTCSTSSPPASAWCCCSRPHAARSAGRWRCSRSSSSLRDGAGRGCPTCVAHKGASLSRLLSHLWLTTEGVFGIALGVSTGAIFVYVLFGTLLDRAGGGNYMMQVSFAALGHLRGGPAKVAVVSSALNGMISGSSVSNVVSGGIFTIPLMKKAGYGGVKAGAIETMSSVNGQIMPPVMGAAAFLMVEYVGIPYSEIVKHAILPATLSYIGLLYIVHLEALKLGMQPMIKRAPRPLRDKATAHRAGHLRGRSSCAVRSTTCSPASRRCSARPRRGRRRPRARSLYFVAIRMAAAKPDLPHDIDITNPRPLELWPTVAAGLHFLLPIGTLIWCLMIEEMSPSLSAFWAIVVLVALMLTQRPLIAWLRKQPAAGTWRTGANDVIDGMADGSRNMIGIGVATATAGIIVGGITLTGLGLRMTEFVEFVSQGNVIAMLLFIAFVCLVLGLGVPTTANYVLVATLMAPVVVELGAQSGLVIPLIAVHLFVFYYGIMGDITPPVGLATFAAAAISGEDAIQTGIQGSLYALRTVILPFIWIFNPLLLLIDIGSIWELVVVVVASTLAMLLFCRAHDGLVPHSHEGVGDGAARDRDAAAVPA